MPSVRLTFVCQAGSRATRHAMFGDDEGMDERGGQEAAGLRGSLGSVDRCWSSPSACAQQTAASLGLAAAIEPALRDCDYGCWTGLVFRQLLLREPRVLLRWMRDPRGGEAIPALIARAGGWADGLLRAAGHSVAVTHPAVIRAAVAHVPGGDPAAFWRIDVPPLSRTELRANGRRWVLRALLPPGSPDQTG